MTKFYKKLATFAATGAMLAQMATPALAGTYNFTISGNGSDSDSEIELENENKTEVFQENKATVENNIKVNSNTGGNDVKDNTGGKVEVETGDTAIFTHVVNQLNSNVAEVETCDCDSDVTAKVAGNGTDSDNKIELENENKVSIVQNNKTDVSNKLNLVANSGDNDVEDNTGGPVSLDTGSVYFGSIDRPVSVYNVAGMNSAVVRGSGAGSTMDLDITGNGSDSDNDIEIESENEIGFFQDNNTDILNDLYFKGTTGDNEMEDNTAASEDPALTTGNVMAYADIFNMTGFNVASGDCGCVLDVTGSIKENGTDSENEIELELEDETLVTQDNRDDILNNADVVSDTGDNEVNDNTSGEVNVTTGFSLTDIVAETIGGTNVFGPIGIDVVFPWEIATE